MLFQAVEEGHGVIHVRGPKELLPHSVAFRFCQIHLSYVETLQAPKDLSRRVALLFQMYSLSKDIYDK